MPCHAGLSALSTREVHSLSLRHKRVQAVGTGGKPLERMMLRLLISHGAMECCSSSIFYHECTAPSANIGKGDFESFEEVQERLGFYPNTRKEERRAENIACVGGMRRPARSLQQSWAGTMRREAVGLAAVLDNVLNLFPQCKRAIDALIDAGKCSGFPAAAVTTAAKAVQL